jgi:pyruvate dehydrogenase E2 component (dihydrolipoamide acetyltransferase)
VVNSRDEIEIGHRMSITLSGDHRVVDGAVAAEYMGALRKLLESPALLLL